MATGENLSRGEMVQWINDILKLNITKIECFGTGAIPCQLIDFVHPGKVQMSKVNWKAKQEYEYVNNFKVLQQSFTKIGITKPIEVEKLSKCKYQDNLEFAQWIKKHFDSNGGEKQIQEYDPVLKRGNADIDFSQIEGKGNTGASAAINQKEAAIQGNKTNSLKKQVAPRYATSIMISNSNELNKSQNLNEEKEETQQKGGGQNIVYESIVINKRKFSNSSNSSSQQKPFNKFQIKNVQSSYEINSFNNSSNLMVPLVNNNNNNNNNNIQNQAIQSQCKEERDFYFTKLKDIDQLLELYEQLNLGEEVDELVFKLKDILYSTPSQQVLIEPNTNVIVTDKSNSTSSNEQNILKSQQGESEEDPQ